jgi:hypothetical protein
MIEVGGRRSAACRWVRPCSWPGERHCSGTALQVALVSSIVTLRYKFAPASLSLSWLGLASAGLFLLLHRCPKRRAISHLKLIAGRRTIGTLPNRVVYQPSAVASPRTAPD